MDKSGNRCELPNSDCLRQGKYAFVFGNRAGSLVIIASLAALLTLVFGIPALPRWQGFVALAVFFFVAYCLLFVRMYVLACN